MRREILPVLLIEGNPRDAVLVQTQLLEFAPDEFEITVVDRLSRAQQQLKESAFAAILLDLSLPDSSGISALSRTKAAAPQVPIIVLSGIDDESMALHAVQHGAQDYLVKGRADGHVIARVIRYAMQRQRADEELRRAHNLLEQRVMERTAFLKVTNRRLHEEIAERERTEETLRKERDFSSAILDTVGAIVVVLDPQGCLVRCNRYCEQVMGYLEAEIKGRQVWDVFLEPEVVARVQPVFGDLLVRKSGNKYENYWLTKDGRQRLIDWSNTVLVDSQGAVEFVIATGIDITEKRATEELERQHLFDLAHVSRLSTMGQMATEIAHELNQPLCAIASFSDSCLRMYDSGKFDPQEVRQVLQEIGEQAQRAGEVIRRIRKFVRKEPAERILVSLNELVSDVVRLTLVEARWNQVDIRTELAEALPAVKVDKILVEQVILNLVRNAIEAIAHAGGTRREIVIATGARDDGTLEVAVRDTGPGLPQNVAENIFQPFFTTKPQGMGMGLTLSLSIVKAHDGQLTAEANTGQGTTFRLVLPAIKI
ncbi:MAG: PAS domain S-box protein [Gammaproteobacteria bacterium]|nr:PAS domain S-box protein [Gammaproteobacteria bacterium]